MRAFSACLSVILGLGACYIAACSSDSTAGPAAGDAGETSAAGATSAGSGGASAGTGGGTVGEAGACAFQSDACTSCLAAKCGAGEAACVMDDTCDGALNKLVPCACDGTSTTQECAATFAKDGGDPAVTLIGCFNDNCAATCEM